MPKETTAVRTRKLGEVTAYAIKRDIAELGWPVGEVLGNQSELMQRYGVSRSTLREAIRQIERHGIARMRRGVRGGLVVEQPARDSVVLSVASYLELAAIGLPELFEAREVVENLLITLICERATDADVRGLRRTLDELLAAPCDDVMLEAARHLALRSAISGLSRNVALGLLLEALYRVTSDMLTVESGHPDTVALIQESRREKRELVEAIAAGDEVQAHLALRSALLRSREQAEQQLRGMRKKFDTASALTLSAAHLVKDGSGLMPKLGHRVSLKIANDIAGARLAPDSYLGTEPDMQVHYGVSRAVFREAVRTLELHSIVRMRRGLGGGLVVGKPDPSYTVELTSIYLQYAKLKPRHFYELWRAIQIAAAQLAARRIDEAGRVRLLGLLEAQAGAGRDEILALHGRVHEEISVLSGNRVLELFTRVMAEIGSYYPTEVPVQEVWKAFTESHGQLIAAITQGEVALARRLMTRHLKLVDAWYGDASRVAWVQSLAEAGDDTPPPAVKGKARKPARKTGAAASGRKAR
ncbi:MAG: FadR/GntR family transcriptional regulator [Solimonas sp.]